MVGPGPTTLGLSRTPKPPAYSRWSFTIKPCNVRAGWEKGRVESGVGYVKKNFLNGLELSDFCAVNPAARIWLVRRQCTPPRRDSSKTPRPPRVRTGAAEGPEPQLLRLRARADAARLSAVPRTRRHQPVLGPGRVRRTARDDEVVARPAVRLLPEPTDRAPQPQLRPSKDFEDPDHPKALLAQRRNGREQRLLSQFLTLSRKAQAYYEGLAARQMNARIHLAKILALAEIYGREATARALDDALAFHAFSSQYIAHLLEARAHSRTQPLSPLSLTPRQDSLELELPEPDLSIYEVPDDE